MQANAEAINKRGVKIQRIFILSDESFNNSKDVLKKQIEAGVEVRIVSPEKLPTKHLLESYQIVDNKIVVKFYNTPDGKTFLKEKVSIEPIQVSKAIRDFSVVYRWATPYTEK